MNTFADFKAMIPAVLGIVALLSGMVGLIARLYHKGALEKKDIELEKKDVELKNKDAELARAIAACAKADERANNAGNDVARNDLAVLQRQLQALVEGLAISVKAQAASLYIPVLSELTKQSNTPRSFAFVAVHNADPRAAAAIRKMGVVEIWTIVGECWQKNAAVANTQLQADTRHLKSYDAESGFVPINTLVLPIRWQDKPIGVLQLFNRQCGPNIGDIDAAGFSPQDKKFLSEALKDLGPAGIASKTNQFQGSPAVFDYLGLQGESILENAVIMHVDLTSSSLLFSEAPLQDAAQMLRIFSEYIHNEMVPYTGVVERFIGDGALIRFHYVGFDSNQPATNPVVRAVHAAERLLYSFNSFKESFWADVATEAIKLRISIALGPVVSINMGSVQSAMPTVMGPCVNRSSKMVAYATRERNVVLVDDNTAQALDQQKNKGYTSALRPYVWSDENATTFPYAFDGDFFELELDTAKLPTIAFHPLSKFSAIGIER